ncbi:MAG TPA: hypothetical protein VHT96_12045 [Clostridia bacterium]|nr:hypothetical protein [Clostridia bacterium]
MIAILAEERFSFISEERKAFITAFDDEINKLGYSCGGNIGDGFCWGRYMIIYWKNGVKGKHVAARIYIRDNSIVLRLFLNDIDKHRDYIENTKSFIKEVFTGEYGICRRCHNDKGGVCKFRKTYTLEDRVIDKCNGYTFEFGDPDLEKLPEYMDLLNEFYALKRPAKKE